MSAVIDSEAVVTYDRLAPYYDRFTATYDYERWLDGLEMRANELGLLGRRALDVACGTGKSTEPLWARGYQVTACDISAEMLREARRKFPGAADAFVLADMRSLPPLGQFDLVICLDDALNYLLSEEELEEAFVSIASCLAPNGIFVFDLNSLRTYRRMFSQTTVREADGAFFAWQGECQPSFAPGELASARVEIFSELDQGLWDRCHVRHVQRHYARDTVSAVLDRAGLQCCAVYGQHRGARLDDAADEEEHIKVVYFAQLKPARP